MFKQIQIPDSWKEYGQNILSETQMKLHKFQIFIRNQNEAPQVSQHLFCVIEVQLLYVTSTFERSGPLKS